MEAAVYYPIQPDYEQRLGYKRYVVKKGEPLYGIVLVYYEFQNEIQEENIILKALPDAIMDMVFKFYGENLKTFIGAGTGRYYEVKYEKVQRIFGLQLAPGAVNLLFPFTAQNVIEASRIELEDNLAIKMIKERLKYSESFEERVAVVSGILAELADSQLSAYETVQLSVAEMVEHLAEYKIEDVARQVGYSYRYFRKLFTENVGYPPAKFMRIIRFQKSYEAIINNGHNRTLTEISVEYGYYDQSHMNKEYHFLMNRLPHELKTGQI